MSEREDKSRQIHDEHRRIYEELKNEHISGRKASKKANGQPETEKNPLNLTGTQGLSDELRQVKIPQEKTAEMSKVDENEINAAVSLLKNPRSLDNSSFRGYESSPQQNDTLDVLDQIKKNVQEDKTALEKLKRAGLSPDKDITRNKIVSPGQFPNLKGAEVIARTKDTLMLVKGRSLFIYELKRLELQAPALGQPGEKLDLRWPPGQEKARGTQTLERDQHHSRVRSQSEEMK